jgi:hypothetical protein
MGYLVLSLLQTARAAVSFSLHQRSVKITPIAKIWGISSFRRTDKVRSLFGVRPPARFDWLVAPL